jgi:hypothetical protein
MLHNDFWTFVLYIRNQNLCLIADHEVVFAHAHTEENRPMITTMVIQWSLQLEDDIDVC